MTTRSSTERAPGARDKRGWRWWPIERIETGDRIRFHAPYVEPSGRRTHERVDTWVTALERLDEGIAGRHRIRIRTATKVITYVDDDGWIEARK